MPPLIEERVRIPGKEPVGPIRPAPSEPFTFSRTPPEVALYIETARDSNEWEIAPEVLDWSAIEMRLDGADCKATIVVRALDAKKLTVGGDLGSQHLSNLLDKLHPDKRVRIARSRGASTPVILFQGYPQTRQASWSERHQAITASAIYEAQEICRTHEDAQIVGRLRRLNPFRPAEINELDLVEVQSQAPVFNPNNKPNRLPEQLTLDDAAGFRHALFAFTDDDAMGAKAWSYVDALRYVVLHYIHLPDVGVSARDFLWDTADHVGLEPAPDSLDPFTRKMRSLVEGVSIQSMNADQAIHALCDAAELHYEYAIRTPPGSDPSAITPEYHLRVFATLETESDESDTTTREMGIPLVYDLPRDKPFTDYSGMTPTDIANRNQARKADLSIDTRAVTQPVFLGGALEYQVTVLLRPGWLPTPETDFAIFLPQFVEIELDKWSEAFGHDDSVGELERDPVTGEFLKWTSKYHRQHPDFASVADVLRRWVFPDDLSYLGADLASSPYARVDGPWKDWALWSPFIEVEGPQVSIWMAGNLGGSVEDALNWVPRPRPFGDTIGRINLLTTNRDPILWLNFHAEDPLTALAAPGWVRCPAKPVIDAQRAAIWIAEDNLWASAALREDPLSSEGDMIEAYLERRLAVAITATIRGDGRLRHAPTPIGSTLTRKRTAIVDLGYERFQFRNRIERDGFRLPQPDPEPQYDSTYTVVDDFKRFADVAAAAMAADGVAGSWQAPYIKHDVRLGDSFAGSLGMGIHFQSFPEVVAIEYVKDPKAAYQTVYHLTDLRHAPDVGAE